MKRTALVLLCLAAFALLLTGCQGQKTEDIPEVTQFIGPAGTDSPTPSPSPTEDTTADFTQEDALAEEDTMLTEPANNDFDAGLAAQQNLFSSATASSTTETVYPYAGSEPIALDPIDAPTPTPKAPLNFTYISYSPSTVPVTFEAPAGWIPDETYNEVFTLSEPEALMKDGQLGSINVYAVPVVSEYSQAELEQEIKQRLNTIGSLNFVEWRPSYTATRYLLGSLGVYAQYTGKLVTGVEVGGRIHAVTKDNVLYCIQITYPLAFRSDFLDVFAKLRETIKRVQ